MLRQCSTKGDILENKDGIFHHIDNLQRRFSSQLIASRLFRAPPQDNAKGCDRRGNVVELQQVPRHWEDSIGQQQESNSPRLSGRATRSVDAGQQQPLYLRHHNAG